MFAVSSLGALAFIPGGLIAPNDSRMIWMTRDGKFTSAEPAAGAPPGRFASKRISPDGTRALVSVQTAMRKELWIADWKRDIWQKCGDCKSPIGLGEWSPDGTRLVLGRNDTLVVHALDGSSPDQVLVQETGRELIPAQWLAGDRILYQSSPDATNYEIKLLEPGSHTGLVVVPLGIGAGPAVSPDGRWLAYTSPPAGERKVVVQAFPGPGARVEVSAGIAMNPVWSADSRTLYHFREGSNRAVIAVDIAASSVLTPGRPRDVFLYQDLLPCTMVRCYDIAPDGQRFLFGAYKPPAVPPSPLTRIDVIQNWTAARGKVR
jgi:hypothetical protein